MNVTENIVEETFTWIITDYDRARIQDVNKDGWLVSSIFGPSEQSWTLCLSTKPLYTTHLGSFLGVVKSSQEEHNKGWERNLALLEFYLNKRREKAFESRLTSKHTFNETSSTWGSPRLVEKAKVAQDYLQSDGSLHIMCKIKYERTQPRFPFAAPTHHALLLSEELSDVTIVAADKISIPAHRALLHPSPFFRGHTSFSSKQGTKAGKTVKSDFSSTTIRSMLEFLYTGHMITHAPQTFEERCDLIRLADMYHLPNLHALVAQSIVTKDLTDETALRILKFAHKYGGGGGCRVLRDECLPLVRQQFKTCTSQPKGYGKWIASIDSDLLQLLFANEGADAALQEKSELEID
ncbi:hypothetical protein HK104_010005 [Borealophlyctis nickersoniae]|nr:hypothetical protein HK104_010005 [Borealophlyctis nickersoniae]